MCQHLVTPSSRLNQIIMIKTLPRNLPIGIQIPLLTILVNRWILMKSQGNCLVGKIKNRQKNNLTRLRLRTITILLSMSLVIRMFRGCLLQPHLTCHSSKSQWGLKSIETSEPATLMQYWQHIIRCKIINSRIMLTCILTKPLQCNNS